jgi:hypothetical protein
MGANKYSKNLAILTETEKQCSKCRGIKLHKDFHNQKSGRGGLASWCKVCAGENGKSYHARNRGKPCYEKKRRDTQLKHKYGIDSDEYSNILKSQGGKCDVCRVKLIDRGTHTHLDHDHKSGKIRGILCTNCNRGLGHFQDNALTLGRAIQYLEKYNETKKKG